jgi:ketosteroid isomerase-like protein
VINVTVGARLSSPADERCPPRVTARAYRLAGRASVTTPLRTLLLVAAATLAACRPDERPRVSEAQRAAIADSLREVMIAAADLSTGDVVRHLMSLYPDSGRVVSASAGRVTTSRDTLEASIRTFWENVGRNMREPRWTWGAMHVDVLGPDAAVLTATYSIPHRTPRGAPHVVGGAWTAVFERRGGRWVIVQEHLSDVPAGG